MKTFQEYIVFERSYIALAASGYSKYKNWVKSIEKSLRRQGFYKKNWEINYRLYVKKYIMDHHWAMRLFSQLSKIGYKIEIWQRKLYAIADKSLCKSPSQQ